MKIVDDEEKWVAITGCAGYIGGQTVLRFKDEGYKIIGVDLRNDSQITSMIDVFIQADFASDFFVYEIVKNNPTAIIHTAGSSLVDESFKIPETYFFNNFLKTKQLIDLLIRIGWTRRIVFSSSAAVYGNSNIKTPTNENSMQLPISPYGESKLATERLLESRAHTNGFDAVSLRYFNVCGADKKTRHGQRLGSSHLIAVLMEALIYDKPFKINGVDFSTVDGTCIRDYVHVEDVAEANYRCAVTPFDKKYITFNVGSGIEMSVRSIIDAVEKKFGSQITKIIGGRREGDPDYIVSSNKKIHESIGWSPDNSEIENIICTAWEWYNTTRLK